MGLGPCRCALFSSVCLIRTGFSQSSLDRVRWRMAQTAPQVRPAPIEALPDCGTLAGGWLATAAPGSPVLCQMNARFPPDTGGSGQGISGETAAAYGRLGPGG